MNEERGIMQFVGKHNQQMESGIAFNPAGFNDINSYRLLCLITKHDVP